MVVFAPALAKRTQGAVEATVDIVLTALEQ
jgi:hypothetical protein